MALRFNESNRANCSMRRAQPNRILKDGFVLHSLLLKRQNTLLDVGRSMFDVRRSFFSNHLILNYIAKVSNSIKLADFLAGGRAET
jgi:hypothetical protein